jgi:hypothetical protein
VSATLVRSILDAAFLTALAVWTGSTLFLVAGAIPLVRDDHRLLRRFLARYYSWGVTCGAIALPSAVGAPLSFPEYRGPWSGVQALLVVAGILTMLDGANRRVPDERLAQATTGRATIVLALNLILLVAFAFRPPPRTAGIIEPTPQQRVPRATTFPPRPRSTTHQSLREAREAPPLADMFAVMPAHTPG